MVLLGLAHCYLGRHEMAIEQIERAQHLSPHDPHAFFFDMALMMPHLLQGDFEEALALGRRAIELNPGFTPHIRVTWQRWVTLVVIRRLRESWHVC